MITFDLTASDIFWTIVLLLILGFNMYSNWQTKKNKKEADELKESAKFYLDKAHTSYRRAGMMLKQAELLNADSKNISDLKSEHTANDHLRIFRVKSQLIKSPYIVFSYDTTQQRVTAMNYGDHRELYKAVSLAADQNEDIKEFVEVLADYYHNTKETQK